MHNVLHFGLLTARVHARFHLSEKLDFSDYFLKHLNNGERKVQGVPQSQAAALPWHQEEERTDKTKQAQIEQTYEKH